MSKRTDRRILKIFLPGFRIQGEISTNFPILQLQRIADSSTFWARILDFACNKNILPGFRIQGKIVTTDLVDNQVNNHNNLVINHNKLEIIKNTSLCRSIDRRVSMGWWLLRLSATILAQLRLTKKLKINYLCFKKLNIN